MLNLFDGNTICIEILEKIVSKRKQILLLLKDICAVETGQWIQVDLPEATEITGVVTQGRNEPQGGSYNQWVTRYEISYMGPFSQGWQFVTNSKGEISVSHFMLALERSVTMIYFC